MKKELLVLVPCLLLSAGWAFAQEAPAETQDPAAPPPIPPKVEGETVEPTVNIRQEEERTIEEYSLNGRVYMVKITPARGLSYYYLDTDGDGTLELQPGEDGLNPVRPAYWKVKEWE